MLAMLVFAAFSYAPAASAEPITPATLNATASVSEDFKTITLSFDSDIEPAGNSDELKNAISLQLTGTNEPTPLGDKDSVQYDSNKRRQLVLTLDTELVGKSNAVRIEADALWLMDQEATYGSSIELNSIVGRDITPPEFVGAESYSEGVKLYFDEDFVVVYPDSIEDEASYLQSQIQIAQDGEHFSPLLDGVVSLDWESNYLQIYSNQNVALVSGPKTKIKLAAGLLEDTAGNVTPELALAVSPPAIKSVELSDNDQEVTVTFDRNIYPTPDYDATDLNSRIYVQQINQDVTQRRNLEEGDKVTLKDNQLIVKFATPLTIETNQIVIQGSTLQDAEGNYFSSKISSSYFKLNDDSDLTPPELVDYVVSKDLKDLTLQFNENVAIDDLEAFKSNVNWYDSISGDYVHGLPPGATVTVSGSSVTIHFETRDSEVHYYYFSLSQIADLSGNHSNDSFNSAWFDINDHSSIGLYGGTVDLNGRFVGLELDAIYSNKLTDLTLDEVGTHLQDKISISTDNGKTFTKLSADDRIVVQSNQIGIFLKNRITAGTIQVKIDANSLTDSHGYVSNDELVTTIVAAAPRITGYLFADADTVLKLDQNAEWIGHILSVTVWDYNTCSYRELTGTEYGVEDGKLTIRKGVFLKDHYYYVSVEADGYQTQTYSGGTFKSSDIFYMTPPSITKTSGITAKVFIYNQAYGNSNSNNNYVNLLKSSESGGNTGTQAVVFELFDGNTPVSIAAAELAIGTGTYSANFSVNDAATKNYTVKAFLVSSFDSDTLNLGLNLGTIKTQTEIDEAMMLSQYNNNNRP